MKWGEWETGFFRVVCIIHNNASANQFFPLFVVKRTGRRLSEQKRRLISFRIEWSQKSSLFHTWAINGHVYGESVSVSAAIWFVCCDATVLVVCVCVCRDDPPFDTVKIHNSVVLFSFSVALHASFAHIFDAFNASFNYIRSFFCATIICLPWVNMVWIESNKDDLIYSLSDYNWLFCRTYLYSANNI